jgi:carbamoyl-phosphate synthase large subunit
MADMDPMATGLYLVEPSRRFLIPRGDAPNFCDVLYELCRAQAVDVCISTVDAELAPLAAQRKRFLDAGIRLPMADHTVLALCRDKSQLIKRVAAHGVATPESIVWDEKATWTRFPAFAKPNRGSGSRGLHHLESVTDLNLLPRTGEYIVQELLPGAEYSVDVYAQPVEETGVEVIAAVIRERMKTDSGIAVTARTLHIPELQIEARRVVESLGLAYVSNVQFKRAVDGTPKFLEVNPRFPGTLPLTAAAGIDIPQLLLKNLVGERLPNTLLPYSETMIVRYWTEHEVAPSEYESLSKKLERD